MSKSSCLFLVIIIHSLIIGCVLPQPVPATEAVIKTAEPVYSTANNGNINPEIAEIVATRDLKLWVSPLLPEVFREEVQISSEMTTVEEKDDAQLYLDLSKTGEPWDFIYYYVLTATFTTLTDNISSKDLIDAWRGKMPNSLNNSPLLLSAETLEQLEAVLGECNYPELRVSETIAYESIDWREPDIYAILPFESLTPNLKVLKIDQASILDIDFTDTGYPLAIKFSFDGEGGTATPGLGQLPVTNRKSNKITRLMMTGVTALVRRLGVLMETEGMTYPASEIYPWIQSSDLLHISNEVAFSETCPTANWYQKSLQFCSRPEYLELLDYLEPDVIELSGNHLLDWDVPAFKATLDLYEKRGWPVYAGGTNLSTAQNPQIVEHNNNKFAFIGCNIAGPEFVWAKKDRPGAAPCDFDLMENQIAILRRDGFLPIVTLQYYEYYDTKPSPNQKRDFDRLAAAGAVIVQGSQSHVPQTMQLADKAFIHYGLGNFLFDQMRNPDGLGHLVDLGSGEPYPAVRLEMIDLHTFYQGRLINTELLTAILEESGKPRPMTEGERKKFLQYLFEFTR